VEVRLRIVARRPRGCVDQHPCSNSHTPPLGLGPGQALTAVACTPKKPYCMRYHRSEARGQRMYVHFLVGSIMHTPFSHACLDVLSPSLHVATHGIVDTGTVGANACLCLCLCLCVPEMAWSCILHSFLAAQLHIPHGPVKPSPRIHASAHSTNHWRTHALAHASRRSASVTVAAAAAVNRTCPSALTRRCQPSCSHLT
jgi:hypothetical protein